MPKAISKTANSSKKPSKLESANTSAARRKSTTATALQLPAEGVQIDATTTKQERMLALLGRPEGASISEMMQATNWQQHSVRGFLAGTVKGKLGLSLTSSKASDQARRYRIKARRVR